MSRHRYRADRVDRRYNDWHYELPNWVSFMDLDGLERCCDCSRTLMLIETSTNLSKPTTIIRSLAEDANKLAYLVIVPKPADAPTLDMQTLITVRCVHDPSQPGPYKWRECTLEQWGDELQDMHDKHSLFQCDSTMRTAHRRRQEGGVA